MKFIYPAVFRKTENETYLASFPDLEGCTARGETLEDAVENANEAAAEWIGVELEENNPLPPVSDLHDLTCREGEVIRNICVNYRFNDGWDE